MCDDKALDTPPSIDVLSQTHPVAKATFIIRIHFHRNATWQGTVTWMDTGKTKNFRSALELLLLMDGALSEQASLDLQSLDLETLPEVEQIAFSNDAV